MENLKLKDFLEYKYLSGIEVSPDGRNSAFIVHKGDYEENNYNSNIWIMNNSTKEYIKLTGMNEEKSFLWLDETKILFPSMRDKKLKARVEEGENWTCFYVIDIRGGEAQEYMRIPMLVTSIKSIDKDNFIITAKYDNYGINLNELVGDERAEAVKKIKESKDYEILDEIPFWSNGNGFTNKKRNRLYVYNRINGELTPISDTISNVSYYSYKDGVILYVINRYKDKQEQREAIYSYDIKNKKTELILPGEDYRVNFVEFFGEGILCGLNDTLKYGINQNPDFYMIKNGKLELFKKHDTWMVNTVGSDCRYGGGKNFRVKDNKLYFLTTVMHDAFLSTIDTDGNEKILTKAKGSVDSYAIGEGEIYFIGLRGIKLQELYSLKNGEEK